MSISFFFILFFSFITQIISLKVPPDNYKWFDNPYENDIDNPEEEYHHILTAVTNYEYFDYYKGIVYKSGLCCYYERNYYYYCRNGDPIRFDNFISLKNINDTNLKELHHYACRPNKGKYAEIVFTYPKQLDNSVLSLTTRFTNIYQEPFELQVGICRSYSGYGSTRICTSKKVFDTFIIPSNSLAIYTLKFDQNYYYLPEDNFSIPYNSNGLINFNNFVWLNFFTPDENKTISINSYIISVELKDYYLSITGNSHNFCDNYGCLGTRTCEKASSSGTDFFYCRYSGYSQNFGLSECSLFGCIPGAYCSNSNTCKECDSQCKGCDEGLNKCRSCYNTAMNGLWKNNPKSSYSGICPFEFFPLNKAESYDINVPIPLNYRMTFEFWINIYSPKYLKDKNGKISLSSFILKDFFTISIHQNIKDINSAFFVLTPFEFFYPFDKNFVTMQDLYEKYLNIYSDVQYISSEILDVTSKWIYIKGGISSFSFLLSK